ncbi:MAG: heme exporter protein CcmD [Rhodocyclaceae bacterium]|nr:heme exporter protein CcmD [Rhodocyclaceae bacterium]
MSWGTWHDFWSMGGQGLYVWGSYAVTLAVIVTEICVLLVKRKSILEHLGRLSRLSRRKPAPRPQ